MAQRLRLRVLCASRSSHMRLAARYTHHPFRRYYPYYVQLARPAIALIKSASYPYRDEENDRDIEPLSRALDDRHPRLFPSRLNCAISLPSRLTTEQRQHAGISVQRLCEISPLPKNPTREISPARAVILSSSSPARTSSGHDRCKSNIPRRAAAKGPAVAVHIRFMSSLRYRHCGGRTLRFALG